MQRFSPSALRIARKRAKVRPERLALDIGRSIDSIRAYEAGRVDPPASVVGRLADVLGIQPGDLYADDDLGGAA